MSEKVFDTETALFVLLNTMTSKDAITRDLARI